MDSGDDPRYINAGAFLRFLFSTLFLFGASLSLMLYVPRVCGGAISLLLRYFVLPKNTLFSISTFQLSPLQARIFFTNLYYQNENLSVRIVDGYFTFDFWGYWFQSPNWTNVKDFMVKENLIGTRCRARVNFKFVKGTIVGVEAEKKRVYVQLDSTGESGGSDDDDDDDDHVGDDDDSPGSNDGPSGNDVSVSTLPRTRTARARASRADPFPDLDAMPDESFSADALNRPFDTSAVKHSAARARGSGRRPRESTATSDPFTTRVPILDPVDLNGCGHGGGIRRNNIPSPNARTGSPVGNGAGTAGDEVVKLFDCADLRIRSKPGLCQLHVNGSRVCVYNATGKYQDLLNGEPYKSASGCGSGDSADPVTSAAAAANKKKADGENDSEETPGKKAASKLFNALRERLKEKRGRLDEVDDELHRASRVEAARKLQRHQLQNKTFVQKFFAFIGAVELEMFATTIDIGGANATHPYFLHITALRGEGKMFLTRDGCCPLDLYRMAVDFTLQLVDMRMAQMDSKLTENQMMRNTSLRSRAQIMFKGTTNKLTGTDEAFATGGPTGVSSDLIRDFGILVDGADQGNVHILFYRDQPNVYAGEEIRRDALPRTGVEVIVDTPKICYGPWLEYCRFQMWQYFLPPNYRPLQALEFETGEPRPNAGIEFFVEFMCETRIEVPFKRRAVTPSPPFGIKDSHHKGRIVATVGAGSQYIQKGVFLFPGEDKQNFEALFMGKNITVWSNCVLERDTIFAHADSVQFFLDRQDDIMWNGRKLWNILPKVSGVELYFFMIYVDFFLDLLNDWQFAQHMYHNVPLTTEKFNTIERAVRDMVPNVKRFELFLDGYGTIYVNANHQNVVYAEDPCDLTKNVFAILKVQQVSFSMVLPSDQYQLSHINEVTRPLKVHGKEIKAYVSLPTSHPLYNQVSMEIPFAMCEEAVINGTFIINVGNQAAPLDKDPIVHDTGRTKMTNYLNLELDFTNMVGTLMGPHIKGLIDTFENIFLDNTMTITPDELFWLVAKLQSDVTTGKNKRKELKQYMESKGTIGNDLEISVAVRITDLQATAATSQAKGAPGVLLSTGQLTFTYVKQFACTDTSVTVTPITARFCDSLGRIPRNSKDNFLTIGAIRVGLLKHFGRMPLKPKVHEALDVHVDGASFTLDMERLVVLTYVLQRLETDLKAQDSTWETEVENARAVAEYAAEQTWKRPQRTTADRATADWRKREAAAPHAMENFYAHNYRINADNDNDRGNTKRRQANQHRRSPRAGGSGGFGGADSGASGGYHFYNDIASPEAGEAAPPRTTRAAMLGHSSPRARSSPSRYSARDHDDDDVEAPVHHRSTSAGAQAGSGTYGGRRWPASAHDEAAGDDYDDLNMEMRQAGTAEGSHISDPDHPQRQQQQQQQRVHDDFYYSSAPRGAAAKAAAAEVDSSRRRQHPTPDPPSDELAALTSDRHHHNYHSPHSHLRPRRGRNGGSGDSVTDVRVIFPLRATEESQPKPAKRRSLLFTGMLPGRKPGGGGHDEHGHGDGPGHGGSHDSSSGSTDGFNSHASDRGSRTSTSPEDDDDVFYGEPSLAFANSVPRELALGFAYYMEEINKAEDDAKDYGLFFLHVDVTHVNGSLHIPDKGYLSVDLPSGLALAESSVNDGNSSKRLSVAIKDATVKALVDRQSEFAEFNIPAANCADMGDYVEVFHLQTSMCVRQFVAYPFDGSLANHRERQREFMEANDYEGLMRYAFFPEGPDNHQGVGGVGRGSARNRQQQQDEDDEGGGGSRPAARRTVVPDSSTPSRRSPEGCLLRLGCLSPPPPPDGSATPSLPATLPRASRPVTAERAVVSQHRHADPSLALSPAAADLAVRLEAAGSPGPHTPPRGGAAWVDSNDHTATDGTVPSTAAGTHAARATAPGDDTSDTTAHLGGDRSDDESDGFYALNSCAATYKSDMLTSGHRFGTCMSVSDEDSATSCDSSETSDGSMLDGPMPSSPRIPNSAFAADGPAGTASDRASAAALGERSSHAAMAAAAQPKPHPPPLESSYCLQEPIPLYYFYRTFYMDEIGGPHSEPTILDYRVPRRPTRNRPLRERSHLHAPLPSAAFYQSEAVNLFPEFVFAARAVAETEERRECEQQRNDDGAFSGRQNSVGPEAPASGPYFSWTTRTADNRKRSMAGATTKHIHVEAVDPITVLVTVQAVKLGAAAAAEYKDKSTMHHRRTAAVTETIKAFDAPPVAAGSSRRRPKSTKLGTAKKSRAREKQKRWLFEDSIVSLLVPCVEVKLLTVLPVPAENLPEPGRAVDGMYCSSIAVTGVQFFSWQSRPPAGVEVSVDGTRRMSASLRVTCVSLVTQIEYEPIQRVGNLTPRFTGVRYDEDKGTIAAFHLANVRGSGKQDTVRGAEGGACHVSAEAVSLQTTRDFLDYLYAVVDVARGLSDNVIDVLNHRPGAAWDLSSSAANSGYPLGYEPGSLTGRNASEVTDDPLGLPAPFGLFGGGGATDTPPASATAFPAALRDAEQRATNPLLRLGFDAGRTVQGKGSIGKIEVFLIDTRKEGRRIVVDVARATTLVIANPNAHFIIMTPHRSSGRNVQLQCVGEIDLVRAKAFPSMLHVLHTRDRSHHRHHHGNGGSGSAGGSRRLSDSSNGTAPFCIDSPQGSLYGFGSHGMATPVLRSPAGLPRDSPTTASARKAASKVTFPGAHSPHGKKATPATSGSGPPSGPRSRDRDRGRTGEKSLADRVPLVYNCSFTLRTLDVSLLYSDMNYVQLKGRSLMGCAENRADKVSSGECIQMEVLTEAISERLQQRLRQKAREARERAARSRYAAPPSTTEQLQLRSSACFFTRRLLLHYVTDPLIGTSAASTSDVPSHAFPKGGSGADGEPPGRRAQQQQSRKQTSGHSRRPAAATVLIAIVDDVAFSAQMCSQYDVVGDQVNLGLHINNIALDAPYRSNADDVTHPQIHQFINAWKRAAKNLHSTTGSLLTRPASSREQLPLSVPPGGPQSTSVFTAATVAAKRNIAYLLTAQAKCVEAEIGLPQHISQCFTLPQLSAFVQGSANNRVSAKIHAHPFTITSKFSTGGGPAGASSRRQSGGSGGGSTEFPSPWSENYAVTLPNIYVMYAEDEIKRNASVLVETVAITVTPLFINHTLLSYEKLSSDIIAIFSKALPAEADGEVSSRSPTASTDASPEDSSSARASPSNSRTASSFSLGRGASSTTFSHVPSRGRRAKTPRRQSLLFLLQGVRVAYLTSVTNLRLTIRRVNATAETSELDERKTLHWVVHVTNAQVALVDRYDHDQMVAAVDSVTKRRKASAVAADNHQYHHPPQQRPGGGGEVLATVPITSTAVASKAGRVRTRPAVGGVMLGSTARRLPPTAPHPADSDGAAAAVHADETEVHRLRATHPLGGFVWGSVELSLTLSSGVMDSRGATAALRRNESFTSYSPELQKALLDTLGHKSSQWELSLYSPLAIVRFGIEDLLNMCFDETRDDIGRIKTAAEEENEEFRTRLAKHRTFRRLQREKKRYEALLKRTEKERMARLRRMTAQVAKDVTRRRGGLALDDAEQQMLLDYFNITSEHRVVATINRILVVVPFGDAAFRSIVEELPDTYGCGKAQRHIHAAACLSRRKFIPTLALKMCIEETSLICSFEAVKRFVPVLRHARGSYDRVRVHPLDEESDSPVAEGLAGTDRLGGRPRGSKSAETDYISSFTLCGRFLVTNTSLYFTDGSTIDDDTNLGELMTNTNVLGGLGILTRYAMNEMRRSRNTLRIASIEAPLHIVKKSDTTTVGAVIDLTQPVIQLSSRVVNILSEFVSELPTERLSRSLYRITSADRHAKQHRAGANRSQAAVFAPAGNTVAESPRQPRGATRSRKSRATSANNSSGSDTDSDGDTKGRLHVDLSARLAAGVVRVYAHTKPRVDGGPASASSARQQQQQQSHARPMDSKFTRHSAAAGGRRHVGFGASSGNSGRHGAGNGGGANVFAQPENLMEALLSVPLPQVVLQIVTDRGGTVYEEDLTSARIEVRAGTIELSPTITSLAKEIEECARVYDRNQLERREVILARVQAFEKDVGALMIPLHSILDDVLLPMPSTLCNVLSSIRMRNAIDLRRGGRSSAGSPLTSSPVRRSAKGGGAGGNPREPAGAAATPAPPSKELAITEAKPVSKSFTGIHITLKAFRLILSSEPVASTALTIYLEENSSIDLLVKVFRRPAESTRFLNKFPDTSVVLCVRRLRAECQTKLEVKSLEITLPEAEAIFSTRHGNVGLVQSIAINLPLSAQAADPNVIVRMQHIAQVLTVADLWTTTLKDTLRSVRRLSARGAPARVVAQKVRDTPLGQKVNDQVNALKRGVTARSERTMITVCVSHGYVRVDLGSGNSHQLFFGEGHLAIEVTKHRAGTEVFSLIADLSQLSVRAEGVLSGVATIGAVLFQMFVITNPEKGHDFIRSPEGRTFRETLAIQNVNVAFKERQLRDIFECRVGSFSGNSMDGIGEEGYTTTDLDVFLSHSTIGVTPSTVPAFLNFVRTVSAMIADQQRSATERIRTGMSRLRGGTDDAAGGGSGSDVAGPGRPDCSSSSPIGRAGRSISFGPGLDDSMSARSSSSADGDSSSRPKSSGRSRLGGLADIPFMGNRLVRVPCGQLRFTIEQTTIQLGSASSSGAASGGSGGSCAVASFPKARLSFAECPCDDYSAVKKVLVVETHNVELYRPGTPRVVIMGFKGVNLLEFYSLQVLGDRGVGFTLTLRQTHPWTGNPRFRDFEEMVTLIKSFTNKRNAAVFHRFGQANAEDPVFASLLKEANPNAIFDAVSGRATSELPGAGDPLSPCGRSPSPPASAANRASSTTTRLADSAEDVHKPLLSAADDVKGDVRQLRPLRASKFSPQLRFGGDVSVNTEVILNWLGITEKMLPHVVNAKLCDSLEKVLYALADMASERTVELIHDPNIRSRQESQRADETSGDQK